MPDKTIYIKDKDLEIWDEAEKIAKDIGLKSISGLLTQLLIREVNLRRVKGEIEYQKYFMKTVMDSFVEYQKHWMESF